MWKLCSLKENVENFVYKRMKSLLLGKNYKITSKEEIFYVNIIKRTSERNNKENNLHH